MSRTAFDPAFEDLPRVLPIFPLEGVLLLPGGRLPLNIFEPRYLAMFDDALASHRLIGMIQPCEHCKGDAPKVYETGCVGRITSFTETDDGRYLVTLSGLSVLSDRLSLSASHTPASAAAPGQVGDLCWDGDFVYVCVAANQWRRSALSAW